MDTLHSIFESQCSRIDRQGRKTIHPCQTDTDSLACRLLYTNGEDWCNNFTVGIEFSGNTVEEPLTDDQIKSAIDYILPIMKEYNIKKENIVTHEFVRKEWNRTHPDSLQIEKVDITPKEHARFMKELEKAL